MKKFLRRIAVLICVMTLFSLPANALADTQKAVLVFDDYGDGTYHQQLYQYEPPYILQPGSIQYLGTNTSTFSVPAGKRFLFFSNITGSMYYEVWKESTGFILSGYANDTFEVDLPASQNDTKYLIRVTGQGSETTYISDYFYEYLD